MNFIASESQDSGGDLKQWGRAAELRYLRSVYRETLDDYRRPTSEWMKRFSRRTLQNIWDNYRDAR